MDLRRRRRRGRIERKLLDDLALDQVLLNDALQDFRRGAAVPDTLRIDHCDRALLAYAQTVRLGAVDVIQQAEFAETALEIIPRFETGFPGAALGLRLVGAKEDVALNIGDVQVRRDLEQAFEIGHAYPACADGLRSSPISGTEILTMSPGKSAASCGTMIPVPVSNTVPAGT